MAARKPAAIAVPAHKIKIHAVTVKSSTKNPGILLKWVHAVIASARANTAGPGHIPISVLIIIRKRLMSAQNPHLMAEALR
jgi:hypothetical protein